MKPLSGLPIRQKGTLTEREREILSCILECWPTSPLEIAAHLGSSAGDREERRRVSSRFAYYLKKLSSRGMIFSKRVGNALVVWPSQVEKYRTIHEILVSEADDA
jgi:hypothetical protein